MKFETGKTYFTRSICDADHIVKITIKSRTAKTIKTECGKTLRVSEWQGVEQVKPWGSYSMAPIIGADRELTPEPAKAEEPQTLAELLKEGETLFTPEQMNEIKSIVRDIVAPVESAKVYNLADYRKKA